MLTAWTTYEELTEDQRRRFGPMVQSRDAFRARCAYAHKQDEQAKADLIACKGDTQAALALSLGRVGLT
jgi:hypothetical protein